MPIMTSLSTRFLGQPRLTKPTLGALADIYDELETTYSSICARGGVSGRRALLGGATTQQLANVFEERVHFLGVARLAAEASFLIKARELADGRGEFRHRERGSEFERGLCDGLLPAAAPEQAQELLVLQRCEARRCVFWRRKVYAPEYPDHSCERASPQKEKQHEPHGDGQWHKVGRALGPSFPGGDSLNAPVAKTGIKTPCSLGPAF